MNNNLASLLKILSGPLAFGLIYSVPLEGLSYNGQVALATFVWAVVWWMARPVPWAIASFLPREDIKAIVDYLAKHFGPPLPSSSEADSKNSQTVAPSTVPNTTPAR